MLYGAAHLYSRHKPAFNAGFVNYYNTFKTTEEPNYMVNLSDDVAVRVLQSKNWFEWDNKAKPLLAGTSLIF